MLSLTTVHTTTQEILPALGRGTVRPSDSQYCRTHYHPALHWLPFFLLLFRLHFSGTPPLCRPQAFPACPCCDLRKKECSLRHWPDTDVRDLQVTLYIRFRMIQLQVDYVISKPDCGVQQSLVLLSSCVDTRSGICSTWPRQALCIACRNES